MLCPPAASRRSGRAVGRCRRGELLACRSVSAALAGAAGTWARAAALAGLEASRRLPVPGEPDLAPLRSSGRASTGEGCQARLPARAAPRRRAARPPRHSWQAAGGSEDAGPAPLGSNYLPAASGPNPLTRRVRSRLTKQGSIRLKCEVGISRKNESMVIAPASPPGRPPARRALAGEIKAAGVCLPEWAPHWEAVSNSFARAPR